MQNENSALVPQEQVTPAIVTGDNIDKASELAGKLTKIVETQKLYANIQGKKFITVEGWNTLGAMLGCFPQVVDVRRETEEGGYRYVATVEVKDMAGIVRARGIGLCSTTEQTSRGPRWTDEYAVMSMAQTRATGKAFRLAFSWIMKMAGYEVTPAEELPHEEVKTPPAPPAPITPEPTVVPLTDNGNPKGTISDKQVKMIYGLLNSLNIKSEEFNEWCFGKFGSRISGLTKEQATQLIDGLIKKGDAK